MPDYRKEWIQKAEIDYFAPFINLWLACNSWYKSHYSEIKGGDRSIINQIKSDYSARNHLFTNFNQLINAPSREGIYFRTNVELLHYSLERTQLQPDRIEKCSFEFAVIDYEKPKDCICLIAEPKINKDGSVCLADVEKVIKLDKIFITSDKQAFFSGLIEIIYQVRHILIHGNLNPAKDEHEIVKYCYMILWDLMSE